MKGVIIKKQNKRSLASGHGEEQWQVKIEICQVTKAKEHGETTVQFKRPIQQNMRK
jgi:hypothetical protein